MSRENFHQCLAAINILCSMFMIGVHTHWVSAVILKLQSGTDGLKANNDQISWIASLPEMGRFFGPLITAVILDKIGRRSIAFICSFLFFILGLIMVFAKSIAIIYYVRIIFGVTQGVMDVTGSIYLAENCTPKMRGIMLSLIPLCRITSFTVEYTLAACGSYKFVTIVNAVVGFTALSTSFFLIETPYYLIMKGRIKAAKDSLLWLRGKDAFDNDLKIEFDKIHQNMELEILKKKSLACLFGSPENYKPLGIALTLSFLGPILGNKIINSYSSLILKPTVLFSVNEIAIIFGVIQFLSACVTPFIIEKYNRRPFLLIILCFMGTGHICIFILFWLEISDDYFAWLIFASIALVSIIGTLTFPLIMTVRAELLPTSVRAVGGSLNIMTSSIATSICLYLFLPITEAFGMGFNFLIFFSAGFLQFILVRLILPETRGLSLVDIQMSFVSNK